ncbi:MAG: glycosyltransferase, partial [Haloechinothrix sp.]
MRVLMLSTNFHPVIGGAESYCRDLAVGLAGRGHDVTVFTAGDASNGPVRGVDRGVTVLRHRPGRDSDVSAWEHGMFGMLPVLEQAVRLEDVDVVHVNSQDTAVLGTIVSLQHGMPLVVT